MYQTRNLCRAPKATITKLFLLATFIGNLQASTPLDPDELASQVRREFTAHAELLNASKDLHIVAFLGNTGAGKSTLVNLLAGKTLCADGDDFVLAQPNDPTAMPIGAGGDSETLYPKSIPVDTPDGDLHFFDLPGFNDTDGSARNLINAAFIKQILTQAASVRFVLVVGQDEFTGVRGVAVRDMFHSVWRLLGKQPDEDIPNAILVPTKSTCLEPADTINFLLKKTASAHRAELQKQLQVWTDAQRLFHMRHPSRIAENGKDIMERLRYERDRILNMIVLTKPCTITDINVSALYPTDMLHTLVHMFQGVMQKMMKKEEAKTWQTLSDFDKAMAYYQASNFWDMFEQSTYEEDQAVGLLKTFCTDPYNQALADFKKDGEAKLKQHVQSLEAKRQERVRDIEERTRQRAQSVIASIAPPADQPVMFDFAFHKDFYEQVCGADHINALATEPIEQEIVRRTYAGFMGEHSHHQMMRWLVETSFIRGINERLQAVEDKLGAVVQIKGFETGLMIPEVARGYEEVYQQFLKGVLIYRPQERSDAGRIDIPIVSLVNPLEGVFDLSRCGGAGQYLSIHTGYRKGKKAESINKIEIWLTPRFLAERVLMHYPMHLEGSMRSWSPQIPFGVGFSWGGEESDGCCYTTGLMPSDILMHDLWELYKKGSGTHGHLMQLSVCSQDVRSKKMQPLFRQVQAGRTVSGCTQYNYQAIWPAYAKKFHICFVS